jgi:hypothetical protein
MSGTDDWGPHRISTGIMDLVSRRAFGDARAEKETPYL